MSSFSPQEVHFPNDGDTRITLDYPYQTDGQSLKVYLNGMLAVIDYDYIEYDTTTIEFKYQLSGEDVVVTEHRIYLNQKIVDVINDRDTGLFHKYGIEDRLMENQKYSVVFDHGFSKLETHFYTKIYPLFTNVPTIRNDFQGMFEEIADHQILFQIYQNGVLAMNIAQTEEDGSGTSQQQDIQDAVDNRTQIPFYARQFVRYRTELDFVLAIYFAISGKGGAQSKVLGSLEIERRYRLGEIEPLLKELKSRLKPWEQELRGSSGTRIAASAVRGGNNNPYELTSPRREFGGGG